MCIFLIYTFNADHCESMWSSRTLTNPVLQVCRASKQFLKLMEGKAVIRINDINPMLFSFVEELNQVKVVTFKCLSSYLWS